MTERIDIHDPIFELCQRLGLEPTNVKQILFEPDQVTAITYGRSPKGGIAMEPFKGTPITYEHHFKVTT